MADAKLVHASSGRRGAPVLAGINLPDPVRFEHFLGPWRRRKSTTNECGSLGHSVWSWVVRELIVRGQSDVKKLFWRCKQTCCHAWTKRKIKIKPDQSFRHKWHNSRAFCPDFCAATDWQKLIGRVSGSLRHYAQSWFAPSSPQAIPSGTWPVLGFQCFFFWKNLLRRLYENTKIWTAKQ